MKKTKKCDHCGSVFFYDRITAKFCSDACKQQAYLERNSQRFAIAIDAEEAEVELCNDMSIENEATMYSPEIESIYEPEIIEATDSPKTANTFGDNTNESGEKKNKASDIKNKAGKSEKSTQRPDREAALKLVGSAILSLIIKEIVKNSPAATEDSSEAQANDNKGII